MPYIGTSPSNGVRQTYDYTATAGQTSFSGSDNNSQTLTYTDSAYIDVYQNGILLVPSDYTATTGTTVVLDTGATVSDTLQIVVYDVFSVADTVSASDGGSFGGNVGVGGTLSVTGIGTFSDDIIIGDGKTIGSASDVDAMTISSGGVVTFSQNTVGAGGMDLLLNSTISSAVAQFDISSTYINSTYDDYMISGTLQPTSDDINLLMSVFESGSVLTGDKYSFEAASNSASSYLQSNAIHRFGLNRITIGGTVGEGITFNIICHNVNSTTHSFCYGGDSQSYDGTPTPVTATIGGALLPSERNVVVNGLRISFESGNIASGIVKVYGIRK